MIQPLDLVNQGFYEVGVGSWKRINGKTITLVCLEDEYCSVMSSREGVSSVVMTVIKNERDLEEVVDELIEKVKDSSKSEQLN